MAAKGLNTPRMPHPTTGYLGNDQEFEAHLTILTYKPWKKSHSESRLSKHLQVFHYLHRENTFIDCFLNRTFILDYLYTG